MSVAEGPFDLGDAKLAPPFHRPGTIAKASAIARLRASRSPLVTVIAPAGYGKTTLPAQWAEADSRPFAWVALDRQDDDELMFMRYVAAAIHGVAPVSPAVFEAPQDRRRPPGRLASRTSAARWLRSRVGLCSCSTICTPSPISPAWMCSSQRSVSSTPVWTSRKRSICSELQGSSSTETKSSNRPSERRAGLPACTSQPCRCRPGPRARQASRSSTATTGSCPSTFGSSCSPGCQKPRPGSSSTPRILDRMCGGLCDAVLKTTGSARTLEALERANYFVVPLDRHRESYRYHHLFGQLLRSELERSEPDLVAELNRRAMGWCIANGFLEAAIFYGHAAGETSAVAGLIDELVAARITRIGRCSDASDLQLSSDRPSDKGAPFDGITS